MKPFIESEEEAELAKKRLEEELKIDPTLESAKFTSSKINWVEKAEDYEDLKSKNKEFILKENGERLFLLASPNMEIKGKPQLIHENMQRIPLLRKVLKIKRDKISGDLEYITQYKFIDDSYDKRFDGEIIDSLCYDFFLYRVIYQNKEYYIFSEKKLPQEFCNFSGMLINLDDISEINNNLKVKKISSLFICKDFESSVKTLDKHKLIDFVKDKGLNEQNFQDLFFTHPDGKIYEYTDDFNLLRKVQMLSGKYEGYPLHLFKMGPVGTGKTTEAEVIDYKFNEDMGILEAANSTLKVLVPSFKEKPANLGYIAKCNRIAIIDEMMKMVESALGHDDSRVRNYFGQMNMLLEHKDRMVGSGNDNSTRIKASAKVCITTNNISGYNKIENHLGIIDPTTLSRMLVWIQDSEEINKIYSKKGIREPLKAKSVKSPRHTPNPKHNLARLTILLNSNNIHGDCVGGIGNEGSPTSVSFGKEDFLTIYDSCQNFIVDFDIDKCRRIFEEVTSLIKGRMQNVWRARGLHHTILILDGITKHRCLFRDYNPLFKPRKEDYDRTLELLKHVVKTWDTDMEAVF